MPHSFQKYYSFLLGLFLSANLIAQQPKSLHPMQLEITCDQTSVLLFPAAIESVDRGSKDILTKKIKGISNVVKLKAASDSMKPTSLHVFTKDGQVYPFNVSYHPLPPHLTIDMGNALKEQQTQRPVKFAADRLNNAQVVHYAEIISGLKPHRKSPRSKRKGHAQLVMQGDYYVNGVLFLQLALHNTAPIPYQVDFVRSYIRDKRKPRRTSITEKEILPLYTHVTGSTTTTGRQKAVMVLAFDKFTISDNKHFSIEVFEKNGDRLLACRLKGKDILKAKKLLVASSEAPGKQ